MTTDFPSKELLEVIRSMARMEEKLDNFMKSQSALSKDVSELQADVADLKSALKSQRAWIAGASAVISAFMVFGTPFIKKIIGL